MLIKVINARGTTRNIEETQLAEYARRGYKKKVDAPNPKAVDDKNSKK